MCCYERSGQAAILYFVLGGLSSGVFLLGSSISYGGTGSILIEDLELTENLGPLLILTALCFKFSVAPLHQ